MVGQVSQGPVRLDLQTGQKVRQVAQAGTLPNTPSDGKGPVLPQLKTECSQGLPGRSGRL